MMKLAILATLAGSAAAFAPVQTTGRVSTAVYGDFSKELGAQMPTGYFGGGFLKNADQARFDRLRTVELKHGRISMLAVTGYLVTYAGYRFPGCEDIPAGFGAWPALYATDDGKNVLAQMVLFLAAAEIANRPAFWDPSVKPEFVGDYRNGALDFGWDKFDDATKMKKRAIELNNGRAAQMGILGLMVHEKLGNVDQLLPPHF